MGIYNSENIDTVTYVQRNNVTFSIRVVTLQGQVCFVPVDDPNQLDYKLVQRWVANGGVPAIEDADA